MRVYWIVPLLIFAACQSAEEPLAPPATESGAVQTSVRSESAEGATAYIIAPENGAVISSGMVHVKFGLSGMGVAPAAVDFPNSGHHHLLVNAAGLPALDSPIPADSAHLHFGLGQTETTLELSPGNYTLQLLLGDYAHIPHDPPVISEPVTITVE